MRPARMIDTPRLVAIMEEFYPKTRYAGRVEMDADYAKKIIAQMIQRHGGQHVGGSCVFVVEVDGTVEGFMAGVLDRIYGVGKLLVAQDAYLLCTKRAPVHAGDMLFTAYCDWAEANPKVYEIQASNTDILPKSLKSTALYQRKGFTECGTILRRMIDRTETRAAA